MSDITTRHTLPDPGERPFSRMERICDDEDSRTGSNGDRASAAPARTTLRALLQRAEPPEGTFGDPSCSEPALAGLSFGKPRAELLDRAVHQHGKMFCSPNPACQSDRHPSPLRGGAVPCTRPSRTAPRSIPTTPLRTGRRPAGRIFPLRRDRRPELSLRPCCRTAWRSSSLAWRRQRPATATPIGGG
jgi:hypothetical protein